MVSPSPDTGPPAGSNFVKQLRYWLYVLGNWTRAEIGSVLRDPGAPPAKAAAARLLNRCADPPTIADFWPAMAGEKTLAELEAEGVDTTVIKHFKRLGAEDGTELEIELHDWYDSYRLLIHLTEGPGSDIFEDTHPPADESTDTSHD